MDATCHPSQTTRAVLACLFAISENSEHRLLLYYSCVGACASRLLRDGVWDRHNGCAVGPFLPDHTKLAKMQEAEAGTVPSMRIQCVQHAFNAFNTVRSTMRQCVQYTHPLFSRKAFAYELICFTTFAFIFPSEVHEYTYTRWLQQFYSGVVRDVKQTSDGGYENEDDQTNKIK